MIPFVKMLADRQAALRDESAANASKAAQPAAQNPRASARRNSSR